ncbi:MAG: LysM peptidoglycan-binding domain-containing protein [Kofleriaceae bacterium]|nr:LysM peptidoglycan-binding domain-containing protein [Kofleriaceae bacterium]
MRLTLATLSAATVVAVAGARADQPPDDYVVQGDETCMEIASKVLGDRRLLPELHRLNPQLGPLPHALRPGQIIKVPHVEQGPDARLTRKIGDVRFRRPSEGAWDAARRGMDLFRAWRVGSEARAAAEITFADTQQLYLREHTVVIIYGPERRRARVDAPEAVLERGTLRSRLAELNGRPVTVTTPSATAELGAGSALVSVDDAGLSTVANHDGRPVALAGKAGGKVAVKAGMGSRVARGQRPEKPRPLPPPPAWITAGPLGAIALADGATIAAQWAPAANAARYRFELLRGAALVAAGEVDAAATGFELHGAPPGSYTVQVASIDRDHLEGKPGAPLAVTVRGAVVVAPGADAPALAALVDDDPLPAAAAPGPLVVARGARIVTDGSTCSVGGPPAAVTVIDAVGPATLTCAAPDGQALAPRQLVVEAIALAPAAGPTIVVAADGTTTFEVTLTSGGALGDGWQLEPSIGLTVDGPTRTPTGLRGTIHAAANAPATGALRLVDATTQKTLGTLAVSVIPPAAVDQPTRTPTGPAAPGLPPPPRPPRWTLGGYVGVLALPTGVDEGTELGNAALPDDVVEGGPEVGARAGYWFGDDLFAEVELSGTPARFVGTPRSALVFAGHAYLGVRMIDRGRFELRALAGAGGFALTSDSPDADDDLDPDAAWGVAATADIGDRLRLRLDGRQHITADRAGGVTDTLRLDLGLEYAP